MFQVIVEFVSCTRQARPKVLSNVLEAIGRTPLVRVNNITKSLGIQCEICKSIVIYFDYGYLLYD